MKTRSGNNSQKEAEMSADEIIFRAKVRELVNQRKYIGARYLLQELILLRDGHCGILVRTKKVTSTERTSYKEQMYGLALVSFTVINNLLAFGHCLMILKGNSTFTVLTHLVAFLLCGAMVICGILKISSGR